MTNELVKTESIWDIVTDPKEIEALNFFRKAMLDNPKPPKPNNPYYVAFDIQDKIPPIRGIHLPKNYTNKKPQVAKPRFGFLFRIRTFLLAKCKAK